MSEPTPPNQNDLKDLEIFRQAATELGIVATDKEPLSKDLILKKVKDMATLQAEGNPEIVSKARSAAKAMISEQTSKMLRRKFSLDDKEYKDVELEELVDIVHKKTSSGDVDKDVLRKEIDTLKKEQQSLLDSLKNKSEEVEVVKRDSNKIVDIKDLITSFEINTDKETAFDSVNAKLQRRYKVVYTDSEGLVIKTKDDGTIINTAGTAKLTNKEIVGMILSESNLLKRNNLDDPTKDAKTAPKKDIASDNGVAKPLGQNAAEKRLSEMKQKQQDK